MTLLDSSPLTSAAHFPKWLTIPRVILGIIILLRGIMFVQDITGLQSLVQKPGFTFLENNAAMIAVSIAYFNLLGGFFIAIGLFTRWMSLLQLPIIIGAILFVNIEAASRITSYELGLSIFVFILLIVFVVKGSGPISADEFFRTYTNAGQKSGYTKKFFQ
jgi:putative oxidoreductase